MAALDTPLTRALMKYAYAYCKIFCPLEIPTLMSQLGYQQSKSLIFSKLEHTSSQNATLATDATN